jgi:D-alanyl-D-alanine endopeptidase (penicillin-binding protein 7)
MIRKFLLVLLLLHSTANAGWSSITAKSWLVADGTGTIIQSENIEEVRAIASITKLMTVMVVLDAHQKLDERVTKFTRAELIQLALVKSDNESARALCSNYPKGEYECVKAMNEKALKLGMLNTRYHEATGLSVFNVSTAEDLVKLVVEAQSYSEIQKAAKTPQIKINIRKKWFVFNNTNPIIGKRHTFMVSKTGYIAASGGCIVMMLDTDVGRRIVVVLGSKDTHSRIPEAEFIAEKL